MYPPEIILTIIFPKFWPAKSDSGLSEGAIKNSGLVCHKNVFTTRNQNCKLILRKLILS